MSEWSRGEMLAVAAARLVGDDDVAVVGLGLPQVAGLLAKRTHAPEAVLLLEIGVFEPAPARSSMGIADPIMWEGASAFGGMLDVLGAMLHAGRVTIGLLGALQVDPYGSVNSSLVVNDGSSRRFNGSGGANDIASLAGRVVVVMRHEPRKFRDTLDFVTSPGHRVRGRTRRELGLARGGTASIVTDRAVIEVGVDGARLVAVHPGEAPRAVLRDTPMPLHVAAGGPAETPPPSSQELELIRNELDPDGWYTRDYRTRPASPASVTSGRPTAAHAFMPPARFTAS